MSQPNHPASGKTGSRPVPAPAKGPPARVRRKTARARRLSVGAALCRAGLDERALGELWARTIHNLADPKHRANSVFQKLLFDAMKECARQLDNDHEPQRAGANVVVQLVHAVPRPPRAANAPALPSAAPPSLELLPSSDPQDQEPS